jgi:RNA polymerase sigma-B factor
VFTQRVITAHAHRAQDATLVVVDDAITSGIARIDVDVRGVAVMDAHAVRFLLQMRDKVAARGLRMRVVGASTAILRLIETEDPTDRLQAHDDPATIPPRPDLSCCGGGLASHASDPIADLLREAYALPVTDPRRVRLRARAIELALPSARRLAKRFSGRGEPAEDLAQVAAIGLITAIDRYDPREPAGFWPYATPTIAGELRRHFRDKGWSIRVPRRLQDVWLQIRGEADGLAQRLGRSITAHDLARALRIDEELVVEARLASRSYATLSLSAPVLETSVIEDYVAVVEKGYESVDNEQTVRRALLALPKRVRHIVGLRFRHEMTQAQIAAAVGLSQMHVSRILAEALATLRDVIAADDVARARRSASGARTGVRTVARPAGRSVGRVPREVR